MTANESRRDAPGGPAAEPTAVLPETAAQLVELERLSQALAESEERARNHWDQYLRAVAELENVASITGGIPPVKRDLNWIHIAQRFPVRITLEKPPEELMRIGASAVVVIRHGDDQPTAMAQ